MAEISRREFLGVSASGITALTIGFSLAGCSRPDDPLRPDPAIGDEVNAWLRIGADDTVTIRIAKAEMGQGITTALAMIVAEELACRWEKVGVEFADLHRGLAGGKIYGSFLTDGSTSVRGSRRRLQQAGANARMRLLQAAATRWGVNVESCVADDGRIGGPAGRSARFGELVAEAAGVEIDPAEIVIKPPEAFTLIGRAVPRLDSAAKLDGSAIYGSDIAIPDMAYGAVLHGPVLGATVRSVDDSAVTGQPGIVAVVRLDTAVAVVADGTWQAMRALSGLVVDWDTGAGESISTDALRARFLAAADDPAPVARNDGDAASELSAAGQTVVATYDVPYLAHACMEPLNCTASVSDGRVDIWVGTQDPQAVARVAAGLAGVDPAQVRVHRQLMGGGFGRRLATDHVREAVQVAAAADRPVRLSWSREDDIGQGYFRPMAALRCEAAVAQDGTPTAVLVRSVADSIFARHRPQDLQDGFDPTSLMGLASTMYRFANYRVESTHIETGVPTWLWRSVGASQNAFALESFLDELAVAAGDDPVATRRRLLAHRPDVLRVLDRYGQIAGSDATHTGFALHEYAGTIVATGITLHGAGWPDSSITVTCVVDCGHVVNPNIVEQQIQGGVVFALGAALQGEITIVDGKVRERNFDRYRVPRIDDRHQVDVHLVPGGGDNWGGIGEVAVPPVAPALCNAIYRATGQRIRSLPVISGRNSGPGIRG